MLLLLEVMAVLLTAMLMRDCCDFEMYDESRLADVTRELLMKASTDFKTEP